MAGDAAQGLGLADGLAAGGPRLAHLPEEGPKDQAQVPVPVAGVLALVLLGQAPARNPGSKEQFELVEGGSHGSAQALDLSGETAGPSGEVRCHRTAVILS